MVDTNTLTALVEPIVASADADLYDLTRESGTVRVLVDRDGGIDLDALAELSREISRAFDDADIGGSSYTLEVSSPGLERPLRTVEHFAGALGESVTVKLSAPVDGARRVTGTLTGVDAGTATVVPDDGNPARTFPIESVQKARTRFEWNAGSKPTKANKRKANS